MYKTEKLNEKRVLLVEDSKSFRLVIQKELVENGFDVTTAVNGKEAFDIFKKTNFPVVLTDIEMPVMDGYELINLLNNFEIEPVIIVLTSQSKSDVIIEIMKKGIYDYIIKPPDKNDLIIKISRALEIYEMKRVKKIAEKEKTIRLEQQLEWYKWVERTKQKGKTDSDKHIFESITRSFNQGSGFGALITLLDLIIGSAKEEGNSIIIDRQMFELIKINHEIADKALVRFAEIDNISKNKIETEKIKCDELYDIILSIRTELKPVQEINNHVIQISEKKETFNYFNINVNKKYFSDVINELLLNAMKFSESNTRILLIFEIKEKELVVSIINQSRIFVKDKAGIPMGYENIIFEPFFRISKEVYENYKSLDFGLGLTYVEKIVNKLDGKISIFNITDYTEIKSEPVIKVNCTFSIPLAADK